ncbi:glycosyltransferase [Mesorhizobium sp.]|uniref:glycosyltransferase family 2 protein n=1 Tax=Mesorhizobium sp. TaxID=1871066 RepID=UPI0025D6318E|nr:glycosyltransferase [Mesorhizobium sp.]
MTVAVIMPVRNGGRFLGEALASMQRQSLRDILMLVVDDSSTDDSMAIAAGHAAQDPRIRAIRSNGRGIVDALNHGLAHTDVDFIARMDSDDVAEPERLERQLAAMMANVELVVLGTSAVAIGENAAAMDMEPDPTRVNALLRRQNPILHPTVMMRRAAVERTGGYRRAFTYAEDYDLWLRLSHMGELGNLPQRLMRLRTHPAQTSTVNRLDQRAAAALARLRFFGPSIGGEDPCATPPAEAVLDYLERRHSSALPIPEAEMKDIAILLRASHRHGRLPAKLRVGMLALLAANRHSVAALRLKLAMRL